VPQNLPPKTRYELTLAEFPVFFLPKADKNRPFIEYQDVITGKGGEIVPRTWRVMPDPEHGFGGETTLQLLFELFQLWHEQGFDRPEIMFGTVHSLLKRMGKSINPDAYRRVRMDLDLLCGIQIDAENAFWDSEVKAYVTVRRFNLFQHWEDYKERPGDKIRRLPFGRIVASDVLYGSILANALLTTDFDRGFFHGLRPIERRLALYLSKMLRGQVLHQRDLLQLARQMPMATTNKAKVKQEIKGAAQGLMDKGFAQLVGFEFQRTDKGCGEIVRFRRHGHPRPIPEWVGPRRTPEERAMTDILVEDILAVCSDEKSRGFYTKVATLMSETAIYRALSETKEVRDLGEIRQSTGAVFTALIRKYAREQDVDL
jgi:hypothetical protein